jgi:hypothetical protein
MRVVLAVSLIVVGIGSFTYWFLFMSWSHSYAAPSFQFKQTMVLGIGAVSLLVGSITGVRALVQRLAQGRGVKDESSSSGP